MEITVWVCPNGCGNYYASSNVGDLSKDMNTKVNSSEETFSRARCPTPACKDQEIDRIPRTFIPKV